MARIDDPPSSGQVKRRNDPLTNGEKWLRNAGLLLALLLVAYCVSSYILNLEPKVIIPPAAQLPSPNALDLYRACPKVCNFSITRHHKMPRKMPWIASKSLQTLSRNRTACFCHSEGVLAYQERLFGPGGIP